MRGLDAVARLCRDMLDATVTERLTLLETELGAVPPNGIDVTPQLIHWTQIDWAAVGWDQWPWVSFVPQRTIEARYNDRGQDGSRSWDYLYDFRAYCYVRGEGYDEVAAARGRLTLAVRECLLAFPKLADGVRILPGGVMETFSDIADVDDWKQSVGAAYVSFQVMSREELTPAVAPFGTVQTTEATTGALP
jgi:hypothetical protein